MRSTRGNVAVISALTILALTGVGGLAILVRDPDGQLIELLPARST